MDIDGKIHKGQDATTYIIDKLNTFYMRDPHKSEMQIEKITEII